MLLDLNILPSISSMTLMGVTLILVGLLIIARARTVESPSSSTSLKESRPLLYKRRRNSILFSYSAGDLIMSHGKKGKLVRDASTVFELDKEYLII
jgi:hypothetical protein